MSYKDEYNSLLESRFEFVKELFGVCNASDNLTLVGDEFGDEGEEIERARDDFQKAFVDFVKKWSEISCFCKKRGNYVC